MSWDSEPPSGTGWASPAPASPGPGTASTTLPELSSAPVHWLYLGIGSAVVGLALPFLTDSTWLAVIGWLLGGTVSIVLLGVFIHRDTRRRAAGWARSGEAASWLRFVLLVLATGAVVVNAWVIADAVARRQW